MHVIGDVDLPAVVISGELKSRDNTKERIVFGYFYDPRRSLTEGQFRSLQLQLKRLFGKHEIKDGDQYAVRDDEFALFFMTPIGKKKIVYVINIKEEDFSDDVKKAGMIVSNRSKIYDAEKFYHEIIDVIKRGQFEQEKQMSTVEKEELFELFSSTPITDETLVEITPFFQILANTEYIEKNIMYEKIFEALNIAPDDFDMDTLVDPAYIIANHYYSKEEYGKALSLFQKISENTQSSERIALDISTRLNSAQLIKNEGGDPGQITDILSSVDDSSLELVTQDDREQYFALQAWAFEKLGQTQLAYDFYQMTVMISEEESSPSIYVAEAREFLGEVASEKYLPHIAAKEFSTAAVIAQANYDEDLYKRYIHKAALQEMKLAKYYATASIVNSINNDKSSTEFNVWQSLKHLIGAYSHSDRSRRSSDMFTESKKIVSMISSVSEQLQFQYAQNIVQQIDSKLNEFIGASLPEDQEKELVNFLNMKISAMLPLPKPILMIIANDGRLLLGGKIGEAWEDDIIKNDHIFSGALSAIMALFQEVISEETPLRMIDAGQTQVMIEVSEKCIGALLVDRELNIIRKALQKTLQFINEEYPDIDKWGSNIDLSESIDKIESIFEESFDDLQGPI